MTRREDAPWQAARRLIVRHRGRAALVAVENLYRAADRGGGRDCRLWLQVLEILEDGASAPGAGRMLH